MVSASHPLLIISETNSETARTCEAVNPNLSLAVASSAMTGASYPAVLHTFSLGHFATSHEVGMDVIKIAPGRVYTGDETFRPIKELMQISEKYLVQPGSYWSLYKGLKKRARKGFCDRLWKKNNDKS